MMTVRAVVFDVYGTLLDVHRLNEVLAAHFPGRAEELQHLWRAKQLEYTWLRSLMGRYRDFRQVTEEAFRFAAASCGLAPGDETVRSVVDAYLGLPAFPEVPGVLEALAARGRTLAVLSNGTREMLEVALRHAGLARYLSAILSVDEAGIYKPHPRVYALVPERLGVRPGDVLFVSANFWDVAGARAYGFRVVWVNRGRRVPDRLGEDPDAVVEDLAGLLELVRA